MVTNEQLVERMREAGRAELRRRSRKKKAPSASDIKKEQQRQQSEAIERWKRGEISQKEASNLVKKISRGGGSGKAAQPTKYKAALEAEQKAAHKEVQKQKQRFEAEQERKRKIMERRAKPELTLTEKRAIILKKEPTIIPTEEIYDPRTQTFVTAPYGLGAGGTAFMRQPTEEERYDLGLLQRPTPQDVMYLGEKEFRTVKQPAFGTVMEGDVGGMRTDILISDIRADKKRGVIRRVEELLPTAGIPLTTLNEPVYLPDKASSDKYQKLISSTAVAGGKRVTDFLREQQAQLKRDIGRYNSLNLKMQSEKGLTTGEISELNTLYSKITRGQRGSGWQIIAEAGRQAEKEGKTVKIFGQDVSPGMAIGALGASVKGYEFGKIGLGFQLGAGIAGATIGATKTGAALLTGIGKVAKPLFIPGVGYMGGVSGYRMYKETGYMPLAIGAGIGAAGGLVATAYGKQLFDIGGKIGKKFSVAMTKPLSKVPLSASKRAEMNLFTRKGGSKYARQQLLKYQTEKSIDVRSIVKEKTFSDFVKYGKDSEVKKFIKDALTKLSKMDIPVAQKQQMANNLLGRVSEARGGVVITDASGNVLSVSGVPTRAAIPRVRKPTLSPTERMAESVYAGTGQYERTSMMGLRLGQKAGQTPRQLLQLTEVTPSVTSFTGLASISRTMQDQDQRPMLGITTKTAQQSRQELESFAAVANLSATDTAQRFETTQAPRTLLDFASKTGQVPANGVSGTIAGRPTRPKAPKPPKPPVPKIPPIFFGFDRKPSPQMVKAEGYNAYYLRHGTKPTPKKNWVKINEKPLTEQSALSMMGREVDERQISAKGKIEKIQRGFQKVQDVAGKIRYKRTPMVGVLNTGDKYWKDSGSKRFRSWSQKKGVKKPLGQKRFIERQQNRLSHPAEKSQLQASRGISGFLGSVSQPQRKSTNKKKRRGFRL